MKITIYTTKNKDFHFFVYCSPSAWNKLLKSRRLNFHWQRGIHTYTSLVFVLLSQPLYSTILVGGVPMRAFWSLAIATFLHFPYPRNTKLGSPFIAVQGGEKLHSMWGRRNPEGGWGGYCTRHDFGYKYGCSPNTESPDLASSRPVGFSKVETALSKL